MSLRSSIVFPIVLAALCLTMCARPVRGAEPAPEDGAAALGTHVVLSWNDLGMHCMNRNHSILSVLPPYNTLHALVIRRGDGVNLPQILQNGVTVEYSIPGNTYSVGKTDFWTYAPALFGVTLPPNIGLTGLGLMGYMPVSGTQFVAVGIPITPFTDAAPNLDNPYQQALVIARNLGGTELARSTPVIPVSTEMRCVSSGCHSSETSIVSQHEAVSGFPTTTPILCAACHADPALGAPGRQDAGYFSFRMHDQHKFLDEQMTGKALCYKCHPGNVAQCLRGVMGHRFNMQCQDCHGSMAQVSLSIENGRTPWVQEPACRNCHTDRFGEPVGQLFRNSLGHGGVPCSGCHGSPHAEFDTMIPADNANMVALQGHSGILTDCSVCHGITPAGAGPHNITVTGVIEDQVLGNRPPLRVYPNPMRDRCTIEVPGEDASRTTVLVFDAQGRTLGLLRCTPGSIGRLEATWDGRRSSGARVSPGVYFIRSTDGTRESAGKVLVLE